MAQLITISGTTIKNPTSLDIEYYYLSKAGRTADGLMHIDKIADKRKLLFKYDVIGQSDMDVILGLINSTDAFFTVTYFKNDIPKSAVCYVGAIKSTFFRNDFGANYHENFNFDLIEQ
jgi:hypothetical protein